MKISLILLLFLVTKTMSGQGVFTSFSTQYFPSSKIEMIDRVITFDDERITIKSVTGDKVKIKTLFIKRKIFNYDDNEAYVVYECASRNGTSPTTVMLPTERPGHITFFQTSLTDPEKVLEYKMLLDR